MFNIDTLPGNADETLACPFAASEERRKEDFAFFLVRRATIRSSHILRFRPLSPLESIESTTDVFFLASRSRAQFWPVASAILNRRHHHRPVAAFALALPCRRPPSLVAHVAFDDDAFRLFSYLPILGNEKGKW